MTTSFVSTSIAYVNAPPHVGYALELVQADTIARSRRQRGEDVFFLTGTDENSLKNLQVAAELGITPAELCDRNAPAFERLVTALGISVDGFIRTSSPSHHAGARQLWLAGAATDRFRQAYSGLYCVGCESYYDEAELDRGRCRIHGTAAEAVSEENWFFDLTRHQASIETYLEDGVRLEPTTRRNEALGFVRQGLRPFSVSRSRERSAGWGVAVPDDEGQTMYVWFDALANYLTGLGYGTQDAACFERYWLGADERIHVIGKDILRFHAVYWPAFLASAGLPLPTSICVHGFLTVDGEKISKSSGTAIDPLPLIEAYGVDALRYYLLRAVPAGADGDFSEARLRELYNADLANGLGNLVRRIATLGARAGYVGGGVVPPPPAEVTAAVDGFRFHEGLAALWNRVAALNQSLEAARPWELLKAQDAGPLQPLLREWVAEARVLAAGLAPFLPSTAARIEASLGAATIEVGEPLFPRLE